MVAKRKTKRCSGSGAHGERIARVEERVSAIEDRFEGIEESVTKMADNFGDLREAVARIETKLDESTPGVVKAKDVVSAAAAGEGDIVIPKGTIKTVVDLFHKHKWGAIIVSVFGFLSSYVLPHLLPASPPGMPVVPGEHSK